MKNIKHYIEAVILVVAIIAIGVVAYLRVNMESKVVTAEINTSAVTTAVEFSNAGETVTDEQAWVETVESSISYANPEIDDDGKIYMYAEDGSLVPDIMSEEIMFSNKHVSNYFGYDYPESGPSVVLNGVPLSDLDFGVDYNREGVVEYMISTTALAQCGLLANVETPEQTATCYDRATLSSSQGSVSVDELEQHVTFTCEKYDSEANTYYLHATQNGPYSGASDMFGIYVNGTRTNTFPVMYATRTGNAVVSPSGEGLSIYCATNDYWNVFRMSRNDLRHMINEEYGTNYEDIEDGDVMEITLAEMDAEYGR